MFNIYEYSKLCSSVMFKLAYNILDVLKHNFPHVIQKPSCFVFFVCKNCCLSKDWIDFLIFQLFLHLLLIPSYPLNV